MRILPLLAALACAPKAPPQPASAPTEQAVDPAAEAAALDAFFDEVWARRMARHPVTRTYLGIGDDHGDWGDLSDAGRRTDIDLAEADLAAMRARFDPDTLPEAARLSFRLFEHEVQADVDMRPWLLHQYPVAQIGAHHLWLANTLMGVQPLTEPAHVDDWLSRLRGLPQQLRVSQQGLEAREGLGVMPPAFAFGPAIDGGRNLITGAPFDDGPPSPLLARFTTKLEAMELDEATREAHLLAARTELTTGFGPAMEAYLAFLEGQAARATTDDGAWKLPDGEAYYRWQLKRHTSTELGPDEIHAIGLREVERIHGEMRAIQQQLDVPGTLPDFFEHVRTHPDLTLPDTAEGREAYLAKARATLSAVDARLDEVLATRPAAPLEVRAVEAFREKASGKAFYQRGTVDGSRPGVFYVNLHDMSQVPTYQLPALAHHEGLPGHHLQLSIAQELTDVPAFRRHLRVTAWSEGWGLYTEWLTAEMGLYPDPYDDFGRLAMELWRAGRLVVDTGIHHQRWTRQQAIDWLVANTPNSETDARNAVERYIVWPGQATAYKMGMLEIQRLRRDAEERLGDRFDLPGFHDVILRNGPVPMAVLGEQVEAWVVGRQQAEVASP